MAETRPSIRSKAILRLLKAEPTGSLKLKQLRKKMAAALGVETSELKQDLAEKVEKLKKRGRIELEGNTVTRTTKKKKRHENGSRAEKVAALPSLIRLAVGGHLRRYNFRAFEDSMGSLVNQSDTSYRAIEREHLSKQPFAASGYDGMVTSPFDEWNYVLCEGEARAEDARGSRKASLRDFLCHPKAVATGLTQSEVAALRLCTGPMGEFYNHYLEISHDSGNPRGAVNPFSSTCRSISCAIGKLMHAPESFTGELYRVILHSEMHAEDIISAAPNRSFLEIGFMSASRDHTQVAS